MADGLTSSEAPFQSDPLKSADSKQMKAADDGSENVNKQGGGPPESDTDKSTPNKTTEMRHLDNGIVSLTDNNTCNNNAHTVPSSVTQSQETEPAETEQSVSYKNITTMSNEIPFHPAVNGPSNNQVQHNDPVKKPRRGISFPKDTFILGSLEPPDPWKNGKTFNHLL